MNKKYIKLCELAKKGDLRAFKKLAKDNALDVHWMEEGPLRYACMAGKLNIVKYLVEKCEADIFVNDCEAFFNAYNNNHTSVVNFMKKNGINVEETDSEESDDSEGIGAESDDELYNQDPGSDYGKDESTEEDSGDESDDFVVDENLTEEQIIEFDKKDFEKHKETSHKKLDEEIEKSTLKRSERLKKRNNKKK